MRHGKSLDFPPDESDLKLLQDEELSCRHQLVLLEMDITELRVKRDALEERANLCREVQHNVMEQLVKESTRTVTGVGGFAFSPKDQQ